MVRDTNIQTVAVVEGKELRSFKEEGAMGSGYEVRCYLGF
jgi:hypothetical protein